MSGLFWWVREGIDDDLRSIEDMGGTLASSGSRTKWAGRITRGGFELVSWAGSCF